MTIQSGFFNSINGDRKYDASWFAQYFASFIGNGVFPNPSNGLQVAEGENMNIVVKPGKGWINGYFVVNDSDYTLTLDNADGVLKRIDRVVMRLNYLTRQIEILVKKGTFASNPVAPNLQRDTEFYELGLADILINNGTTFVTQSNIMDMRLNSTVCGIVHGVVNQVDTTTIFNQYESWFKEFTEESRNDFLTWFDDIRDILDGDVAGNILNILDNHENRIKTLENKEDTYSQITDSLVREVAGLKLKQEAAERIEGGVLFGDDFKGSEFNIKLNASESVNVTLLDGALTLNIEDVVAYNTPFTDAATSYYIDRSGTRNNTNLINLGDGKFVLLVFSSSYYYPYLFKSSDGGVTWQTMGAAFTTGDDSYVFGTIEKINSDKFIVFARRSSTNTLFSRVFYFDGNKGPLKTTNLTDYSISDSSPTSLQVKVVDEVIHLGLLAKTPTQTNAPNLFYTRATVDSGDVINIEPFEKWTNENTLNVYMSNINMTIIDGKPVFVYQRYRANNHAISILTEKNGIEEQIFNGGSYEQRFVDCFVDKNGNFHVTWVGGDVSQSNDNVRYAKSFDNGVSWRVVKLTTTTSVKNMPTIYVAPSGTVNIVYMDSIVANVPSLMKIKNTGAGWETPVDISRNSTVKHTQPIFVEGVGLGGELQPLVYWDETNNKITFIGNWTETEYTPVTSATAVLDVEGDTDYVGMFVQKQGDVSVQAYLNNQLMDYELYDDEYQFTKQLTSEVPAKLRLELSRDNTVNGDNDKVTRILGGIA